MLGRPNNLNTLYISKNFKFNTTFAFDYCKAKAKVDNQQETKNNILFFQL
jgi:hypothetical protein